MSMSVLAEATCAVRNVRTPVQKSKNIAVSKFPNVDILKISEELNETSFNSLCGSSERDRV